MPWRGYWRKSKSRSGRPCSFTSSRGYKASCGWCPSRLSQQPDLTSRDDCHSKLYLLLKFTLKILSHVTMPHLEALTLSETYCDSRNHLISFLRRSACLKVMFWKPSYALPWTNIWWSPGSRQWLLWWLVWYNIQETIDFVAMLGVFVCGMSGDTCVILKSNWAQLIP